VTHANLLANVRMIQRAGQYSAETVSVSWLPFFHDMGLIGELLEGLYLGAERIIMPPEAFLMSPVRWLRAMTHYGARQCGAPDFAYALCARRIPSEKRTGLDLRRLDTAYVGSEPVRPATMEAFSAAFAPFGFKRTAFRPSYGLAEATLMVSGGDGDGPHVRHFSAAALEERAVEPAVANGSTRSMTGCGHAWLDGTIAIVDPDTHVRTAPGRIGEIWVAGTHVTDGYLNRPKETESTFHARIAGENGSFLRTGDLGFLMDGDLFVAGRLKELIIIAGRNHHPFDIERTVEGAHAAIRPSGTAAFSVDHGDVERLVIVAEIERAHRRDAPNVVDAVRRAVADRHAVAPHAVVLVKAASCPRTTSGKVQRFECRDRFLAGRLDQWRADA
jgi:acyl-CoA synthetase (AMP-forming)/AMP-acid ligase II